VPARQAAGDILPVAHGGQPDEGNRRMLVSPG
jgi:hypothetical protein